MPGPNFFIVGAPKCGTTALYEYLNAHPDIFMPIQKEPHFFGTDLTGGRFDLYRDEARYLSLFNEARDGQAIGEGSVWYLYSKLAAQEIHAFDPNARIIIMLRDPVQMLYSLYRQFCFSANEDQPSFADALAAEADRKQGRRIPSLAHTIPGLYYRDVARYSEQVARYLQVFDREQIHIILFDDFVADTAGVYRDVLAFLGLDEGFRPAFERINISKEVRSPGLIRMLSRLGISPLMIKNSAPVQFLMSRMPSDGSSRLLNALISLYARPARSEPIDPALRHQLLLEFAPDIDRLANLIDRDLSHWHRQ